jgi:hypothetical protein
MRVPDAGITPGNGNHTVEIGLPVADQNHPNSFIILREAREKAQALRVRAVELKTELRRLALERACWDAI